MPHRVVAALLLAGWALSAIPAALSQTAPAAQPPASAAPPASQPGTPAAAQPPAASARPGAQPAPLPLSPNQPGPPGAPAAAAEPAPSGPGLCQCVDDRSRIRMSCLGSPDACQSTCGTSHFSFVPDAKDSCAGSSPK